MYYADLTPYEYLPEATDPKALNVGWLDAAHSFPNGEMAKVFKNRLFEFCLGHVNLTRGFHLCGFCGFTGPVVREQHTARLGSAEIRVIYQDKVYAAPDMVYHYVVEHGYKPPVEFVDAVLCGPAPDTPEYRTFIEKYYPDG